MRHPLIQHVNRLNRKLRGMEFSDPVACVYNPLEYALAAHRLYLNRYGTGTKRVIFLGMNPGPYGMVQTGVPFGEIGMVRDWMGIEARIGQPPQVHPKRPVQGFACTKSEVSGRRLWGLMAERHPNAEDFFADHIVLNYCPLVRMTETGKNLTPDKLPRGEMAAVNEACDAFLIRCFDYYRPEIIVGVGVFAEKQAQRLCTRSNTRIGRMLHPSPASPLANRHWPQRAIDDLVDLGVWRPS